MLIGKRIKEKRIELGLSVDHVATLLNKNRATIYRYENGDIENLPTTVLEPLADILKTTPAYLMGWVDEDGNWLGDGCSPEEDFQSQNKKSNFSTIAAHATEDLSMEEQTKVLEYINFLKSQRK